MLHAKANLSEPVQNLLLLDIVRCTDVTVLFDFSLQVSAIGISHDNAQLSLFGLVDLLKLHDIRVMQDFKDLGLLHSLNFFLLAHGSDVNFLNDGVLAVRFGLHEECFTKGALSEQLDLLIAFE